MKVGLGTDVAGGYSLDIMNAMRQAVIISRIREGANVMSSIEGAQPTTSLSEDNEGKSLSIDWKESLYLATRGGAIALGLPTGCGSFELGSPFDAQQSKLFDVILSLCASLRFSRCTVRLFDPDTCVGVGALDFFDLEDLESGRTGLDVDMVEKWWCLGDDKNRVGMWVQGVELTSIR